ncbi:MAG: 50S ribosomal protein L3 [Phycisphaerae bacterium]|nr:50S ribosomal protein L3 [Phycisphaerae bacterium]
MVPSILGIKMGMTQVFEADGSRVPVTIIQAGPCTVLQTKSAEGPDAYNAIQVGLVDVKPHRSTLAQIGHCKKAQTAPKRHIREIRLEKAPTEKVGDVLTVEMFAKEDVKFVDVRGISKGKGTQGVMVRWGFGGQPASHGTERKHRSPGSIGSRAAMRGQSGMIKKGQKMAGHVGAVNRTVQSQKLVGVDVENNLLLVRGGVPGPEGGLVVVQRSVKRANG